MVLKLENITIEIPEGKTFGEFYTEMEDLLGELIEQFSFEKKMGCKCSKRECCRNKSDVDSS